MADLAMLTSDHVSQDISRDVPCHTQPLGHVELSLVPELPPKSPRRALSERSLSVRPPSKLSVEIPLSPIIDSAIQLEEEADTEDNSDKMGDDGNTSDASSICHSPSWSDYGTAEKKRKEKKRQAKLVQKELEKQEKQKAKATGHKPRRLSKAPPPAMQKLFRSATAPLMPAVPLVEQYSALLSQVVTSTPQSQINRAATVPTSSVDETTLPDSNAAEGITVGTVNVQQLGDSVSSSPRMIPQPLRLSKSYTEQVMDAAPPRSSDSADSFGSMLANIHIIEHDSESYASRMAREPYLAEQLSQDDSHSSVARYRSKIKGYTTIDTQPQLSPKCASSSVSPTQFSFVSSIVPDQQYQNEFANFSFGSPTAAHHSKGSHEVEDEYSGTESEDEETNYHSFVTSNYVAPELAFVQITSSEAQHGRRLSIGHSRQSFGSLRDKARSAFTKRPLTSSNSSNFSRPPTARSHTTLERSPTSSKIERMFGTDTITTAVRHPVSPPKSRTFSVTESVSSASLTDGSESRPSSDAGSEITTPTSSRAHSVVPHSRVRKLSSDPGHVYEAQIEFDKLQLESPQTLKVTSLSSEPPSMKSMVTSSRKLFAPRRSSLVDTQTNEMSLPVEPEHQALALRSVVPSDVPKPERSYNSTVLHGPLESSSTPMQNSDSGAYLRNARRSAPRPVATLARPPTQNFHPQTVSTAHNSKSDLPRADETPIAKMFVVCCNCKFFHDLPSKIYEAMAKGPSVVQDTDLGISGVIKTQVSCPWCQHGMSTDCCAGYAGVVYLRERFH